MNVVKSALLDESYYEYDHPSGLKILVYPKEGYQSAYAIFGTRYGSIDTRFRLKGEQEWTVVPEGIAHFSSISSLKARTRTPLPAMRAPAPMQTLSPPLTEPVTFSPARRISAHPWNPAGFVQSPYFTKETVDKEQGIIGQEIRMYDDEPQLAGHV